MIQIGLTLILYLILVIPAGQYLYKIAAEKKTFADPVFDRVDGLLYKIGRIHPQQGMNWKEYVLALMTTNVVMIATGYLILRLQDLLLWNPNGTGAMEPTLAFHTVVSFMTNTNLQHYFGETGMSHLSQMAVVVFMMFVSAGSGYAAYMAFIRGITGKGKDQLGNFFADLIRIITRVLLPLSLVVGLLLVWQGVPQNLRGHTTVQTLEGSFQQIAGGPIAALESIKHLGTNGGGFLGANSAAPLENPTVLSNLIQLLSMMLLPGACVMVFGKMAAESREERRKYAPASLLPPSREGITHRFFGAEGRSLFAAMGILFLIGLTVCFWAESQGNPALAEIGLNQAQGNLEGKEVRFGVAQSALFTTATTSFTTGSVNNMHDTLTPLGGLVALLHMMLNVVFGGKGVGLMNMTLYAILAVFLCGLMVGRTPEYLGKKIEGKEMKLTALAIIVHPLLILSFTAIAVGTQAGQSGITNPGFHGLTQVLYEYASSAANNGSGFEGLQDSTVFWNLTTGIVMFLGRYIPIVLQLAIAGSLMKKNYVNETAGTLQTGNLTFAIILVVVVYIFAALTFFPALVLGPVAEHLTLWA